MSSPVAGGTLARALGGLVVAIALAGVAAGCRGSGRADEAAIRALLEAQAREWNAGNLAGYMEAYEKSDRLRFHSGGDVALGWQPLFDRYRNRYQDRAAMGILTFSDLSVEVMSPAAALAHGRWRLQRAQDQPSGLFTLLLRKQGAGWRISYDHTSSK